MRYFCIEIPRRCFTLAALGICQMLAIPHCWAETVAVWDVFSPFYHVDVFSTDCALIRSFERQSNWMQGSHIDFYIDTEPSKGGVPLFQYHRASYPVEHIWTTSPDAGGDKAYVPEGLMGYIYPSPKSNTRPLYQILDKVGPLNHHFFSHIEEWQEYYRAGSRPDLGHGFTNPNGIVGYISNSGTKKCDPNTYSKMPRVIEPFEPGCYWEGCGTPKPPLGGVTLPLPEGVESMEKLKHD